MRVTRLQLRDFRSYERGELRLGPGLTVVAGRNGAGKTNLLEGIYFACTGRSCRTATEREVVRFGAQVTRLVLDAEDEGGDVLLKLISPLRPGLIQAADGSRFQYLLMPIRLNV